MIEYKAISDPLVVIIDNDTKEKCTSFEGIVTVRQHIWDDNLKDCKSQMIVELEKIKQKIDLVIDDLRSN